MICQGHKIYLIFLGKFNYIESILNDFYNSSHYFVGVLELPIAIRKNAGVALKSKELRVCAMDVLGFYYCGLGCFEKKQNKTKQNKTKQNRKELRNGPMKKH
jgi:hypothetical protein